MLCAVCESPSISCKLLRAGSAKNAHDSAIAAEPCSNAALKIHVNENSTC
jgi:hypothetical protein